MAPAGLGRPATSVSNMAPKGDAHRGYAVHGDSVDTIRAGFDSIGMLAHRQAEAQSIVREVVEANGVVDFRWYKPDDTPELCCYWDDLDRNVLWVTVANVHIPMDRGPVQPERPLTWSKEAGAFVGWLLPGAESGSGGGGRPKLRVAEVRCPVTFILQPAGQPCPDCEIVHSD